MPAWHQNWCHGFRQKRRPHWASLHSHAFLGTKIFVPIHFVDFYLTATWKVTAKNTQPITRSCNPLITPAWHQNWCHGFRPPWLWFRQKDAQIGRLYRHFFGNKNFCSLQKHFPKLPIVNCKLREKRASAPCFSHLLSSIQNSKFGSVNLIVAKSVFLNIFIEPYFHKAVQVIFRLKAV